MFRRLACAAFVLALTLGVASAEMIKGKITKIDDKSVTIVVGKKGDKMEKTLTLASKVKVSKMVKKNNKEELSEGLKAEPLQNLPAKGLSATVITDDDNKVTEIIIGGGKKKKNN
jgi:hypothetical protein